MGVVRQVLCSGGSGFWEVEVEVGLRLWSVGWLPFSVEVVVGHFGDMYGDVEG